MVGISHSQLKWPHKSVVIIINYSNTVRVLACIGRTKVSIDQYETNEKDRRTRAKRLCTPPPRKENKGGTALSSFLINRSIHHDALPNILSCPVFLPPTDRTWTDPGETIPH